MKIDCKNYEGEAVKISEIQKEADLFREFTDDIIEQVHDFTDKNGFRPTKVKPKSLLGIQTLVGSYKIYAVLEEDYPELKLETIETVIELLKLYGLNDEEVFDWMFSPIKIYGELAICSLYKGKGEVIISHLKRFAQGNIGS